VLGVVKTETAGHWIGSAMLSVIHLAALGFFTVWLAPRPILFLISRRVPGKLKLALALNFFTGMLLLQLAIKTWRDQAGLLALMFVVLWAAARLLNRLVMPEVWAIYFALFGGGNNFESASPQGRYAKFD